MSLNLIEVTKSYFTDNVVEKLALANNTPVSKTQTALDAILPILTGGLVRKITSEGNVVWLMDLLKDGNFGSIRLSNLGLAFTNSAAIDRTGAVGENLTRSLFGNRDDDVARAIAGHAGIGNDAASGLMEMSAPGLMSVIGQQMNQQNLDASGLTDLILGQANYVEAALPPGLASLSGLLGIGSPMETSKRPATPPVSRSAPVVRASNRLEETSGGTAGWLPLLIIGAALGLLWYFVRGCENKPTETGATVVDSTLTSMGSMVDSAGSSIAGAASSAMADLGKFGKRTLPNGVELNVPASGIENKLVGFIEDNGKSVDKETWFSFDRLEFATGRRILLPESQEQLANIAAIMEAYPGVHLKLGGYTDNTGNRAANMKLSTERANRTMAELVRLGVAKGRLTAEGYGPQHPIAPNDTPEGRQLNRRIDVRVTKR